MTSEELPVVEPPFSGDENNGTNSQPTVVGVILAAGSSSRYGETNKLLVEWEDTALVSHATETVSQSAVDATVVVGGEDCKRVQTAVADSDAIVVCNDAYSAGQSTSVRCGLRAARELNADAVIFALGDMPAIAVESIDVLVAAYRSDVGDALAAACDGIRGNPVLFGCRHFEALANITGDIGGRAVFRADDSAVLVETGDSGVLVDVDHPRDVEFL